METKQISSWLIDRAKSADYTLQKMMKLAADRLIEQESTIEEYVKRINEIMRDVPKNCATCTHRNDIQNPECLSCESRYHETPTNWKWHGFNE